MYVIWLAQQLSQFDTATFCFERIKNKLINEQTGREHHKFE